MLPGLVSNSWAQVICPPPSSKVLGLQARATMPGQDIMFKDTYETYQRGCCWDREYECEHHRRGKKQNESAALPRWTMKMCYELKSMIFKRRGIF